MATALALTSIIHFESDAWINPAEHTRPEFSWQDWADKLEQERLLQNNEIEELYAKRIQSQSNTDITFQMETTLKQILTIGIIIPRPATVRDYLLKYSDITNLIPHVCQLARKYLGKDTNLSLEVYRDQESEDEYLALYVRQEKYEERLTDKIEEVCSEYEFMLFGKSGWFIVTTDFRSPH
ncbi:hypothetical protein BAC1_00348 [uncultured bacterium]|nr:hypothetical protein BAC1_00348 [uncultured bacterium]